MVEKNLDPAKEEWEILLEEHVYLDRTEIDPAKRFEEQYREVVQITADTQKLQSRLRLRRVCELIHSAAPRHAICLSGGGIRSATFNLGIIQGLARACLLDQFDYLSTVSGGGYIGSWLSAWIHRTPGGVASIQRALRGKGIDPSCAVRGEAEEISHLREYSNYLTPKLGWLSGDTWALLATYPRNLFLNWLVIVPLAFAVIAAVWLFIAGASFLPVWNHTTSMATCITPWLLRGGLAIYFLGICGAMPLMPSLSPANARSSTCGLGRWWRQRRPLILVALPIYLGCLLSAASLPALITDGASANIGINISYVAIAITLMMAVLSFFFLWLYDRKSGQPRRATAGGFVFILLIYLVATCGWISAFYAIHTLFEQMANPAKYAILTIWIEPVIRLVLACLFFTIIVGLTSEAQSPDMEETREWWSRLLGHLMFIALMHFAVIGVVCISPAVVEYLLGSAGRISAATVLSASSFTIALLAGRSGSARRFGQIPQSAKSKMFQQAQGAAAIVALTALSVGMCWLFVRIVAVGELWPALDTSMKDGILNASYSSLHYYPVITTVNTRQHRAMAPSEAQSNEERDRVSVVIERYWGIQMEALSLLLIGLIAFALLWSWPINVNRFSLYGTYRMRLVRAYLGASRGNARNPNEFTGFDGKDNIPLHFLRRRAVIEASDIRDFRSLMVLLHDGTGTWWEYVRDASKPKLGEPHLYSKLGEVVESPVADWDMATDIPSLKVEIVEALNSLLNDSDMLTKAFESSKDLRQLILDDDTPRKKTLADILDAHEQIANDGSPALCNRLILEYMLRDSGGRALLSAHASRPLQVLNGALNLVGGQRLAWQQRKARSFIFTPFACGSDQGYRSSARFSKGMTLGGAMTVSGAAASPNMGYHSSPAVTALMTLFNIRLGCWLGNPTTASQAFTNSLRGILGRFTPDPTYRLNSPRFSIRPLIDEAFGRTTEDNGYIYVSDGGHFENLGLYEMVRRRCKLILVSDASCDPDRDLSDLGNVVRKIRIDLGIPIKLRRVNFRTSASSDATIRYCTIGRIQYEEIDGAPAEEGLLIYFKPTLTGKEPVDIYHYSQESGAFPHESTADQWFSESQFESYRRLGQKSVEEVLGTMSMDDANEKDVSLDLHRLRKVVEKYVGSESPEQRDNLESIFVNDTT